MTGEVVETVYHREEKGVYSQDQNQVGSGTVKYLSNGTKYIRTKNY